MKVFLSWSGELSQQIAELLKAWLSQVIQTLHPYVSSEDIDKGARWSSDLAKELEESNFGIVCVTRENAVAPWIHFESGALSKTFDATHVCPLLIDMNRTDIDAHSPLLQFHQAEFNEEDIKKLIVTLNRVSEDNPLPQAQLDEAFALWWPKLYEKAHKCITDSKQAAVQQDNPDQDVPAEKERTMEILLELLELARYQVKQFDLMGRIIQTQTDRLNERLSEFRKESIDHSDYYRYEFGKLLKSQLAYIRTELPASRNPDEVLGNLGEDPVSGTD
jgi:hypothetical protein